MTNEIAIMDQKRRPHLRGWCEFGEKRSTAGDNPGAQISANVRKVDEEERGIGPKDRNLALAEEGRCALRSIADYCQKPAGSVPELDYWELDLRLL